MKENTNQMEDNYIVQVQSQVKGLVDELNAVLTNAGLWGEAGGYKLLVNSQSKF